MIDTHAHIYLPEFANDQAGMIQRAKDAGVKKILMPGIDHEVIDDMMKLAETEKGFCYAMMGLHPCSVKEQFEKELSIVAQHFANENHQFVAVGECGLDYYWG
jgi:TatD DNase family protein